MRTYRSLLLLLVVVLLLGSTGCSSSTADYRREGRNPELLHDAVQQLTEVMIHDIFSPPQASRAYAYTSIAAYEALVPGHPAYRSLAGQLNGLDPVPQPDTSRAYYLPLSSLHAYLEVAEDMVYSVGRMKAYHESVHEHFRQLGMPEATFEHSLAYGDRVAQHILAWKAEDNYEQARSAPRYTVMDVPGRWRPTPPAYMNGINPNWGMLRPFVMDSANQFMPPRPIPFSMEEESAFYQQVMEVYKIGADPTKEQREIASFWDCNPYALHTRGHAMFAVKKITPGGHWMYITTIAARKTDAGLMRAAQAYASVAVALADGFISAWDEKYRSKLVRPETVINRYIDPDWRPILQTPPFPEYPSAHSVTSASAATVLTELYGPSFAFRDTSEVAFGLPVRAFDSFLEAAHEAAVSRLYGGIHYPMAAQRGFEQGRQLGKYVVRQITTKEPALVAHTHSR